MKRVVLIILPIALLAVAGCGGSSAKPLTDDGVKNCLEKGGAEVTAEGDKVTATGPGESAIVIGLYAEPAEGKKEEAKLAISSPHTGLADGGRAVVSLVRPTQGEETLASKCANGETPPSKAEVEKESQAKEKTAQGKMETETEDLHRCLSAGGGVSAEAGQECFSKYPNAE